MKSTKEKNTLKKGEAEILRNRFTWEKSNWSKNTTMRNIQRVTDTLYIHSERHKKFIQAEMVERERKGLNER